MEPMFFFYRLDETRNIIPDPIVIERVTDVALSQLHSPFSDIRMLLGEPGFKIEFQAKDGLSFNDLQEPIYGVTTPLIPDLEEFDETRPFTLYSANPKLPMFHFGFMGIGFGESQQKWIHTIVPCIRAVREIRIPIQADNHDIIERLQIDVLRTSQPWTGDDAPLDLCWFPLDKITPLVEIMATGK